MSVSITEKLNALPQSPGVYIFKDSQDKIIYIGKAKLLVNRVRSYFQEANRFDKRIYELIHRIVDLEWVVTLSESDALILEDQLIKLHKPKYNILLKDNKTYPYIKLSISEKYPRLFLTRKIEKDGSIYYGPYSSVFDARITLQAIHKYFPIRTSKMNLDDGKIYRPCINFQMNRCLAPCRGVVAVEEYREVVDKVQSLLKGDYEKLLHEIKLDMDKKSEMLNFEKAAKLRDQIQAVKYTLEKKPQLKGQKIDCDLFGIIRQDGFVGVQILFIRTGVVIGTDFNLLEDLDYENDDEILRSFFSKIYLGSPQPPPSIIFVPKLTSEINMLEDYINKIHKVKITIKEPNKSERKNFYQLCLNNGLANMKLHLASLESTTNILQQTKVDLNLINIPSRVECYDISNLQGTNNVASLVVFDAGKPQKSDYKRYKIKSVVGVDDYAAMNEVLTRRLKRFKQEGWKLPDLIIIDGGLGQLNSALSAIKKELGDNIPFDLIGLAKGRSLKSKGLRIRDIAYDLEYIVKSNQKEPIFLNPSSISLHYLQRVRDEAHRFAQSYHKLLRNKEMLNSSLDSIVGIGTIKKKMLLLTLGGINGIKLASLEKILSIPGISESDAKRVYNHFH